MMGDIVDNITDIKSSNAASSVTSPVAVVSLSGPADASKQPPSVEEHSNDKSSVHAVAAEMTTTQKDAVSDTDIAGDGTIVCDVDIQAPSKSNELEKEPVAGVPSSTTSASTASEAESQPQTNTEAATDAVQIMDNGTTGVIPAGTRMVARSRFLVDPTKVLEHNAWDDVEWDKDHFEYARKRVAEQALHPVDEEAKETYEREAGKNWDEFYGRHNNKFFKDRQWLYTEFPELFQISQERVEKKDALRVLEMGCGVGNTVFPLLQTNPHCYVYACDISQTAVGILREHERYNQKRCTGFVCDISNPEHDIPIEEGSLDVITMIFVLSAVQPAKFHIALDRAARLLKPGSGLLLFRDYGEYDMSQLRFKRGKFAGKEENELAYVRGDGTRTYYFSRDELVTLMEAAGMDTLEVKYDKRLIVNRKTEQKMYRNWVQARFRRCGATASGSSDAL